jgi:hypothetical protein
MNPQPNPAANALRSYCWQGGLSMTAYFIAVYVIGSYVHPNAMANPWRILVALLPIIPIIFAAVAFIRFFRATDELKRQIIVTTFAIAGGVYVFFNITCGLLVVAGIPKPSALCAFYVFSGSAAIASVLLHRHYCSHGR